MKVTIEEWQEQFDFIDSKIKELKDKKNVLIRAIGKKGFDYVGGKVIVREEVYGAFWDITYYSHFDGYKSSAVYEIEKGAIKITKENFEKLKSLIKEYKVLPDTTLGSSIDKEIEALEEKASWAIEEVGTEYLHTGGHVLKHFDIVDENTLEWNYVGRQDQEEFTNDSSIVIKLSTIKEIEDTPWVDKTEYN
jgi:hypothetical protein